MPDRLIIGISGASGVIYGIRLLEVLAQDKSIETHLVVSPAAKATIAQETVSDRRLPRRTARTFTSSPAAGTRA